MPWRPKPQHKPPAEGGVRIQEREPARGGEQAQAPCPSARAGKIRLWGQSWRPGRLSSAPRRPPGSACECSDFITGVPAELLGPLLGCFPVNAFPPARSRMRRGSGTFQRATLRRATLLVCAATGTRWPPASGQRPGWVGGLWGRAGHPHPSAGLDTQRKGRAPAPSCGAACHNGAGRPVGRSSAEPF